MKMYPDSVIRKTGQWWKVQLGFWMMALTVVPLMINDTYYKFFEVDFELHILGIFAGMAAFFFILLSVRCPECGAKWLWLAASKRGIVERWGKPVLFLTECPECKLKGNAEQKNKADGFGSR